MDLTLTRFLSRADGIFSRLFTPDGSLLAVTLEHAYLQDSNAGAEGAVLVYSPKIPLGAFACHRGMHQLASMTEPFETFEICGVQGHCNLLFHAGNFNKDSEGCILLGEDCTGSTEGEMVTNSRATFTKFMQAQTGIDSFTLTVNVIN